MPKPPPNSVPGRRVKRLITNAIVIFVISVLAALAITHQTGGAGFSMPPADNSSSAKSLGNSQMAPADKKSSSVAATDGYKLETGPLAVTEVSEIVLRDSQRNKELHLRVFYPVETGKYPLIIFSHGAGGSQNCCDSLTRHWATYGYVTIQPTHEDSYLQHGTAGNDSRAALAFAKAVHEALKNPALWESRPRDISFILDSLPDLQKRIAGLSSKIDTARIGIGGHSMGSYTSEAIAGALIDLPNKTASNFSDPRVKAFLCLSPQGPGQFGLTSHSFDNISLPYLGITGSQDSLGPIASPAWHKIPFERSQPGNKFHLFITGANHMSFISAESLLPARSSQAAAIFGYTNSASLAFWDGYLKDDPAARQFLQSDAMETSSHGVAKLSRR